MRISLLYIAVRAARRKASGKDEKQEQVYDVFLATGFSIQNLRCNFQPLRNLGIEELRNPHSRIPQYTFQPLRNLGIGELGNPHSRIPQFTFQPLRDLGIQELGNPHSRIPRFTFQPLRDLGIQEFEESAFSDSSIHFSTP